MGIQEPTSKSYPMTCVPTSIGAAWTYAQKGYPVRIAISKIDEKTDHSQAEAMIDGQWVPLTPLWDKKEGLVIKTWERHFGVEPHRYLTLPDWIREQEKFAGSKP